MIERRMKLEDNPIERARSASKSRRLMIARRAMSMAGACLRYLCRPILPKIESPQRWGRHGRWGLRTIRDTERVAICKQQIFRFLHVHSRHASADACKP
jgi:hypothetical protein